MCYLCGFFFSNLLVMSLQIDSKLLKRENNFLEKKKQFPHYLSQFLNNGLGLDHMLNKILLRMCDFWQPFCKPSPSSRK